MLGRLGLVLCVAVSVVSADVECGPLQRIRVKTQWSEAFGDAQHRHAFAQAVWRAIFNHSPEAVDLFGRVHGDDILSPEFRAHALRVAEGLDMTIAMLDDPPVLEAQLAHLKGQHIDRHINSNYFEVFGKALEQVFHAAIGHCFDHDSWDACYHVIANGIKA